MFKEFYDLLPPYGQVLLTLVVVGLGGLASWTGLMRRTSETSRGIIPGPVPLWAMMGPVHEVMQTIHDMAEDQRRGNVLLADVCRHLNDFNTGQEYTHDLLEAMLRNQELLGGHSPPPRRSRRPLK